MSLNWKLTRSDFGAKPLVKACTPACKSARPQGSRSRLGHVLGIRIAALLLLLAAARGASAVEHPGVVPKDANCSSCHSDKTKGASVHSTATLCTVCHLARTQGDMTTVNLSMPKEQICFACHEKATELRQHSQAAKGRCVDCHDAHRSDQRMLLREVSRVVSQQ